MASSSVGYSSTEWAANALKCLNISTLRKYQADCLRLVEEKKDGVVILPTGYGKSLSYQVAPYVHRPTEGTDSK